MIDGYIKTGRRQYQVRAARREDVPAIVALLADDVLGAQRETNADDLEPYFDAFDLIASHSNQELIVVTDDDGAIVATFDFSVLGSLSRKGAVRAQVEAVRVARTERGSGLGTSIFRWLIAHARERACSILQLTTDRSRDGAQVFYEQLGFSASHFGYKLDLTGTTSDDE